MQVSLFIANAHRLRLTWPDLANSSLLQKHKKKNHSTDGKMNESTENKRAPESWPRPPPGTRIPSEIRDCDSCCWRTAPPPLFFFYTLIIILVKPKVHHKTTGCHTEQDLINNPTLQHFYRPRQPFEFHQTTSELHQCLQRVFFFLNVKLNHVKRKIKHI